MSYLFVVFLINLYAWNVTKSTFLRPKYLFIVLLKDSADLLNQITFYLAAIVSLRPHFLFLSNFNNSVFFYILVLLHSFPLELFIDLIELVYAGANTFILQIDYAINFILLTLVDIYCR
jgi:hypothetical protein